MTLKEFTRQFAAPASLRDANTHAYNDLTAHPNRPARAPPKINGIPSHIPATLRVNHFQDTG
jgi:hypothetical protein